MSRSNPSEQLQSPSARYFEWSGGEGGFSYYDKEKKEKIKVGYPFTFLVLDVLVTLKGYNEPENKGYWANEVKAANLSKSVFTVKSKSGVEMVGSYKDCKEKMGSKGLDYVQSVYVLYKEGDKSMIANLQLKGAAIGPWIQFCKLHNIYKIAVTVNGHTEEKKGRVTYFAPVYKAVEKIKEETQQLAVEFDKELQEYLAAYFAKTQNEVAEDTAKVNRTEQLQNGGIGVKPEQPKAEVKPEPALSEKTLNVDDLPNFGENDDLPF